MNRTLSPYKVLFVDDEPMAIKYFSQTFDGILTVLTAGSVDEAIAILSAEHAHIGALVTDQRMPGKQGVALLQYARNHYPQITRLLTTAYADLTETIAAVNSGEIFRYIKKPWDSDQLMVDIKIAMDVFALTLERDELVTAKMSVFQQLAILGRIKDLVLISTVLQAQLPKARAAIRNYLTDAHQILKAANQDFVVDVDHLDLGHNLAVETQRSIALITELTQPYVAQTMTPAQEQKNQALQTHMQALRWPEHLAHTHMLNSLWLCYQSPPELRVQGQTIEIKGKPTHDLWGILTANIHADLRQASHWLRFYLWVAECGLTVSLRTHTVDELCISLSTATSPAHGIDAEWLDDLFDQFSQ